MSLEDDAIQIGTWVRFKAICEALTAAAKPYSVYQIYDESNIITLVIKNDLTFIYHLDRKNTTVLSEYTGTVKANEGVIVINDSTD